MAEPWPNRLSREVPAFLDRLQVEGRPGRYLPCLAGATAVGREVALGFSCFALKLEVMLGCWAGRTAAEQSAWLELLRGFQRSPQPGEASWRRAAFVDPAVDGYWRHFPWPRRLS